MIKDSIDFDNAINNIITKTKTNIILQDNILESEKLNMTFTEIEKSLNTLYEKTRFIEDAIEYATTFLNTKVKEFNDEMYSVMKEIEEDVDSSKKLAYITYNVPLKANNISIKDKNNNNLQPLILKDKVLTLGNKIDNSYKISSVKRITDTIPYDDTLNNLARNNNYRAFFLEEKIAQEGLTETLIVYFKNPVTINTINFNISNCKIKNIYYGMVNGQEEYDGNYNKNLSNKTRTINYIKFDIVCTNYTIIEYELDKNLMPNNIIDILKEYELSCSTDLNKVNKINEEYILTRTTTMKSTNVNNSTYINTTEGKSIKRIKLYNYIYSLNSMSFDYIEKYTDGYFISDSINIGQLSKNEYISIETKQFKDANCSIEYAILDGDIEKPIMRIDDDLLENILIFNNKELDIERNYETDSNNYIEEVIKKDGTLVELTYEEAKKKTDGRYTITYKSGNEDIYILTPINPDIKIKCYIRTFGSNIKELPYIDMINIRKYGEDSLWINRY